MISLKVAVYEGFYWEGAKFKQVGVIGLLCSQRGYGRNCMIIFNCCFRLFGQYLYLHHRMHSTPRPLKRLCHTTNQEMLIGSVTTGFELYAVFSPLTSKATAMNAITKLLRWIKV